MMARAIRRLGVWLDGRRIADLEQRRFPEIRCRYTEAAFERWPLNSPVISCSLPLSEQPQDALPFFKGLLPEGQALQALADQAGIPTSGTLELLARYGRDVAGALVISEDEPEAQRHGVERYVEDSLARAVDELDEHPLGADEESELSLAGIQDKLLLVALDDGDWGRPLRGRPSTHILKRDDPRFPGLVEAEAGCLKLARFLELTTVEPQLEEIGGSTCLIVPRYDRTVRGETVERVHQEDLCQALGIDPDGHRRRAKYEHPEGPSLRQMAQLLLAYAGEPRRELDRLLAAATFTVLIGNADAHGKNLSLLHPTPETIALAPLYDTVPTVMWETLRKNAAMSIGGAHALAEITIADLIREAESWPHPVDRSRGVVAATVAKMTDALDQEVVSPNSALAKLMRRRIDHLLAGDRV